ncbi:MAG: ribosome small subunit-dependent GTPase [Pseudomonadota bacterium]
MTTHSPGTDLGLVVANHGRHCIVETPEGRRLPCTARGKKSEAVVGDRVHWRPTHEGARGVEAGDADEGVIEKIEPRRNLLYRQDEFKTKSFAANLDLLLVWIAVEPVFSESQLARALIAAESVNLEICIALNKTDLPGAPAQRERLTPYVAMGYTVLEGTLKQDAASWRAQLDARMAGRATLVLGPSGAGKSTLVNALAPGARAQVGEISQALNSGRHTTTSTLWYWLDEDGDQGNAGPPQVSLLPLGGADAAQRRPWGHPSTRNPGFEQRTALIDSPGFQEFGLRQLEPAQLPALMPDIGAHAEGCKFYNCSHLHEPGCGVIAATQRGQISASRYRIYAELHQELARSRY